MMLGDGPNPILVKPLTSFIWIAEGAVLLPMYPVALGSAIMTECQAN